VRKGTPDRAVSGTGGRKLVLKAMMDIIEGEGVDRVSARRLATAAGMSVGSVYNTDPNGLSGLVDSCKESILADLQARLGKAARAGKGKGVEERLVKLADAYLAFADARTLAWMALFEAREMDPAAVDRRTRDVFSILEGILSDLPGLDDARRPLMARAVWSAVHGIVYLGRRGNLGPVRHENVPEMIRALVGALVAGLGDPTPRR
jgi:AcrR family transcriptional regulator